VAFVSNNSFIQNLAFDGMRLHLSQDFNRIYHIDLKGNARTSGERRRKEAGNVFDDAIRVGVGITLLVRSKRLNAPARFELYRIPDYYSAGQKQDALDSFGTYSEIPFEAPRQLRDREWITDGEDCTFDTFHSIADIFTTFSPGVNTARDSVAYNFDLKALLRDIKAFADSYNGEVDRYSRERPSNVDSFVDYGKLKWSRNLKRHLRSQHSLTPETVEAREAIYRPFSSCWLFLAEIAVDELGKSLHFLPTVESQSANRILCLTSPGSTKMFHALATNRVPDFHTTGDSKCFGFYTYDEDGSNRRENITDWALDQFCSHYHDKKITKWDIFHYVYAVLHHPEYHQRYAANLKRELPRIPLVSAPVPQGLNPAPQELKPVAQGVNPGV
jgi:predicted helicase